MYILNNETKEYAKECFDKVVDMGIEFKLQDKFREKIFEDRLKEQLFEVPYETKELKKVIEDFQVNILPYCSNFSSKKFMGFPDAGNSIASISGALLADLLQQNLINSTFCAPIATYMEIAVIRMLREVVGYKNKEINNIWDVGGVITAGGTGSNSIAMLLARENHDSNTMEKGVRNPESYKVIIPKGIGHYSIKSSLMWIGCGDNIIEVPTVSYKYDLLELEKTLKANKGKVMAVVAYVGDSRSMTIDNLQEVHRIVKSIDENIWLHADACHGFSLGFSEKLKQKISGIELFDSISTDPHKVLMTPYTISALLLKEPHSLKKVSSTSDLIMKEDYAFGQVTPFIGSKSWMSLKLWFLFQNLGKKKIGEIVEKRCEMAQYLKNKIDESCEFVRLNNVDINSVMFMYVGNKSKSINYEKVNQINKDIKKKIDSEGNIYLHQFSIPDDDGVIKKGEVLYPLRYMSGNDNITTEDIDDMLLYVKNIANNLE